MSIFLPVEASTHHVVQPTDPEHAAPAPTPPAPSPTVATASADTDPTSLAAPAAGAAPPLLGEFATNIAVNSTSIRRAAELLHAGA